jgi:hypothetical protein
MTPDMMSVGDVYAVFVVFIAPIPLSGQSVSHRYDPVLEWNPPLQSPADY